MAEGSANAKLPKSSEKLVQCPLASIPGQAWLQGAVCAPRVSGPGAGQPQRHQERCLWSLWWWHFLPQPPFPPWPGLAASALPFLRLPFPCEVLLSSQVGGGCSVREFHAAFPWKEPATKQGRGTSGVVVGLGTDGCDGGPRPAWWPLAPSQGPCPARAGQLSPQPRWGETLGSPAGACSG